jgi:hypothetical protein
MKTNEDIFLFYYFSTKMKHNLLYEYIYGKQAILESQKELSGQRNISLKKRGILIYTGRLATLLWYHRLTIQNDVVIVFIPN